MNAPKSLLFDLDGTLTNNQPGIRRCISHALRRLGQPEPTPEALVGVVGPPLRQTFARLLNTTESTAVETAIGFYRERYHRSGWSENSVYEGVAEALERLRRSGHVLFVCTSKPRVFAVRILEHFALAGFFQGIHGPELDGRHDCKNALMSHLLAAEGLDPANCLMIGDREHDALAARANGVAALGVLYGFGTRAELEAAGVTLFAASAPDLPPAVRADRVRG